MSAHERLTVKILGNSGASISRRDRWGGLSTRFVPPRGRLTTHETAAALRTNRVQVQRLIARGEIRGVRRGRRGFAIPVSEVRRLLKDGG